MRVLEFKETECDWLKPEDLAPALLDETPPILLADLGGYCGGQFSGYCPTRPIFSKEAGGEIVVDSELVNPKRPERSRRRLLSTVLHEIAHRLTPEEIRGGQAHGAVFAAVCFALTARCLGAEDAKPHLSLYDVQDAPDKAAAFAFAFDFGSRHLESGVPARELPALARAEWAALASARTFEAISRMEADRRAEMAEAEAETLRRRLSGAKARLAGLEAEKARRAERIRKVRPWLELSAGAAFLVLLSLAY